MKFLMPRVYRNLLDNAKEYYNDIVELLNSKDIIRKSDTILGFRNLLDRIFSNAGHVTLNERMSVVSGEYPSSSKYNEFLHALRRDITTTYNESVDLDKLNKMYHNYMKSYTSTYDGLIVKIGSLVNDVGMISTRGDGKRVLIYTNEFTDSNIGSKIGTSVANGVLRLSADTTNDVLRYDNILDAMDTTTLEGAIGYSSYRGKLYGTLYGDDSPRMGSASKDWKVNGLQHLFDEDEINTYYEVEYALREDSTTNTSNNFGAKWILGKAKGPREISKVDSGGKIYRYKGGVLVYQEDAVHSDYFRDSDGAIIPRKMTNTIEVKLVKASEVNRISITRKLYEEGTEVGDHMIYAENIETYDGKVWSSIPQFSNNILATSSTTRDTSSMHISGTRGNKITNTSGRDRITGVGNTSIPSINWTTPMISSTNKWAADDSWSFPTRLVYAIRFTLYTNIPSKIRYTMGQYKINKSPTDTFRYVFYQYNANALSVDLSKDTGTIGKGANIINKAIHLLSSIFLGSSEPVPDTLHETYDIDPKCSDMYRWSIELSDVSATGEEYIDRGTYVSAPYNVGRAIDRISIFSYDNPNDGNIRYYIVTDDGDSEITPIESNGDAPKIIYIDGKYKSFRVKIVMDRGSSISTTPEIDKYSVKVMLSEVGNA